MVSEESIGANTISRMMRNIISNQVRRKLVVTIVRIDIVRELRLVHYNLAVVTSPLEHVLQVVLDHETISLNVVTINDDSSITGISSVGDGTVDVMVSSP